MIERLGIKLYTAEEAGQMLGYTTRTIKQMRLDGRLTSTRIGRQVYITEEALREYLHSNRDIKRNDK